MRCGYWLAGCFALVAVAADAQTETAVVVGQPADPCLAIGGAKQAQWSQTPLMIRESRYYSDHTIRVSEVYFTDNHAYGRYTGKPWNTEQMLVPERRFRSAEAAAQAMRLDTCRNVGAANADQPAHIYAFNYLPDRDGTQSTGQMVIADKTGLPIEQDIAINAENSSAAVPYKISATFVYGDAVELPADAKRAEYERRAHAQQFLMAIQNGHGGIGF